MTFRFLLPTKREVRFASFCMILFFRCCKAKKILLSPALSNQSVVVVSNTNNVRIPNTGSNRTLWDEAMCAVFSGTRVLFLEVSLVPKPLRSFDKAHWTVAQLELKTSFHDCQVWVHDFTVNANFPGPSTSCAFGFCPSPKF